MCCSEQPQPSIRDLFGLGSLLRGADQQAGSGSGQGLLERLAAVSGEDACYAATRSALEAAMDEAEQRALWARFKVQ